jgi:GntR family transcriptional regulator
MATLSHVGRLDHTSPLPLHAQAEQLLRRMIDQPEYRNGCLLPDEVSLASQLGISRNTLRAAIGRLVTQGRLERRAGLGTRVCEPRVHSGIGAWHSFTHEMEAKGIHVETYSKTVELVKAPAEAAEALRIAAGTEVLFLCRVRGWEGKPEVEFRSYFHPRVKLAPEETFDRPLYELIREKTRLVADESFEEISAVPADRRLARILGVRPGEPLLRRDRTVVDTARRPIEFAVVHYRCERFHLTLNLRHQ